MTGAKRFLLAYRKLLVAIYLSSIMAEWID